MIHVEVELDDDDDDDDLNDLAAATKAVHWAYCHMLHVEDDLDESAVTAADHHS